MLNQQLLAFCAREVYVNSDSSQLPTLTATTAPTLQHRPRPRLTEWSINSKAGVSERFTNRLFYPIPQEKEGWCWVRDSTAGHQEQRRSQWSKWERDAGRLTSSANNSAARQNCTSLKPQLRLSTIDCRFRGSTRNMWTVLRDQIILNTIIQDFSWWSTSKRESYAGFIDSTPENMSRASKILVSYVVF